MVERVGMKGAMNTPCGDRNSRGTLEKCARLRAEHLRQISWTLPSVREDAILGTSVATDVNVTTALYYAPLL